MYLYNFVKENLKSEEVGEYTAYGIEISCLNGDKRERVRYICDVFTNEQEASRFVEKCNRLGLSPIHIDEAVEDYIGVI